MRPWFLVAIACLALAVAPGASAEVVDETSTVWCGADAYVDGTDPAADEVEPEPDVEALHEPAPPAPPPAQRPWELPPNTNPPASSVAAARTRSLGDEGSNTGLLAYAGGGSTAEGGDAVYDGVERLCSGSPVYRYVKVADFHVADGMTGVFYYRKGRETRTETLASVNHGPWTVGGWRKELRDRGSSVRIVKRGDYHRTLLARYEYRLYRACYEFHGCIRTWRPRIWTGTIARSKASLGQLLDREHWIELGIGHTWTTDNASNKTYNVGLSLMGVGLSSQAGYSDITQLSWTGRACARRWLGGHHAWPTESPVIYAWSSGPC